MKRSYAFWYLGVGLVLLLPVGWRVLSWSTPEVGELDPAAVMNGKVLFTHEWKPNDPLASGGDGLGPVFNATSCVACHQQPILGGSSGLEHNVTNFIAADHRHGQFQGVVHAMATRPEYQETLAQVDPGLPAIAQPSLRNLLPPPGNRGRQFIVVDGHEKGADPAMPLPGRDQLLNIPSHVQLSQRNTPALFGAKLIDEIPDRVIIAQERLERVRWGLAGAHSEDVPVGRALRLAGGQVGKFGWKGQSASLLDFVQAACANELGLSNPAHGQPAPLSQPGFQAVGFDLTNQQCKDMRDFIASLSRPQQRAPEAPQAQAHVEDGGRLFAKIGCADCHTPSLGSVDGLYSDLLLHRMGQDLEGQGSYHGGHVPLPDSPGNGPQPDEWRTPPLWGVADSGPYLHDGRAATLEVAIQMHGGQAQSAANRFQRLNPSERGKLVLFLKSLRAP